MAIPQADEQQRLLANLIGTVTSDRKPLPRFWYLPRDEKAAVVMTGDDHGNGGTRGRFDGFAAPARPAAASRHGSASAGPPTSIRDALTNAQADRYTADGFEIALHVNTNCARLHAALARDDRQAASSRSSRRRSRACRRVVTNRTHCIAFSDWATEPKTELEHGIRLDTNYYYWPGSWVGNRPGFFTGSGMPMRFADSTGR